MNLMNLIKENQYKMPNVLAWIGNYKLITTSTWNHVVLAGASVIAIFFIIVFTHIPMEIRAYLIHDDRLFVNLGNYLAHGEWLGPFSQMILAKGPGYPLFLAANYWLGLPVSMAHALFHCIAAALFGWVITRISSSRILGLTVFCLLLWHPLFLTQVTLRGAIYTGQIILVFALATYSLLVATERRRQIQGAVAAGLMLGWCWLTREEGITLLPGLAMLILIALFSNAGWSKLRRNLIAGTVGVAALAFFTVQTAFQLGNYIAYGSFIGVDFKETNFVSAVNALQSVRDGELKGFVPVSHSTREKIYSVSPAFATLKDYLETCNWDVFGCQFMKSTCGEIAGGWFLWALRDAAASRGHYQSPAKASEFFGQLASEVNTACADGNLKCERSWIPYMPYTPSEQLAKIPERFTQAIRFITFLSPSELIKSPSAGDNTEIIQVAAFLNHPKYTQPQNQFNAMPYLMKGWYFNGTNAWFTLTVKTPDGQQMPATMTRDASPDLVKGFGTDAAKQQRFTIETSCNANCRLLFYSDNKDRLDLSIDDIIHRGPDGGRFSLGPAPVRFDIAQAEGTSTLNDPTNDPRIKMAYVVADKAKIVYTMFMPWLLALGGLAFICGLLCFTKLQKFKPFTAMMGVAASLWLFALTKTALLVLIDVSSFLYLGINADYLSPVMYLTPVAALLSLWAVMRAMRDYLNNEILST